jgi:hypothetical protein
MENAVKKNPIKLYACGSIKAAIWADSRIVNSTLVEFHSVKIDRSYKDGEEWRHSNMFNAEDLPKVVVVAMEAYKFIRLRSPKQDRTDELSIDNGPQGASEVLR